jgi:predicted PurR-regulated permease PerM
MQVTDPPPSRDLARVTLGVLVIGLLMLASLFVLEPFLAAIVWAGMLVVATWPLMRAVQTRLGGRRWIAIVVMTLAILLILILPFALAVGTIADHTEDIAGWVKSAADAKLPAPPGWVAKVPLAGPKIAQEWERLAATSHEELAAQAAPYARSAIQWFVGQAGGIGRTLVHLLLTLVITVIFYASGEKVASGLRRFAQRLAGERGVSSVVLAGQAIRAVALGVVVTALVQSVATCLGLLVCGIPGAMVLTAAAFMLCIAQLGPMPVLLPAAGWLYWSGDPVWGTVLLVWTLLVGALDNVLRPMLIKRGADLPLILIFAGVIGGLLSLGIIGLFIGPVVLAVTYRLLESWIADIDRATPAATPPPAAS